MDKVLAEIDAALKRKGISASEASRRAVNHPSLIKNFRMEREGEKRYNLSALEKLAKVLDLELYFGPPRGDPRQLAPEPPSVALDHTAYAALPLYDVRFSAGPGAVNDDGAPVRPVALHRDILAQLGVASGDCLLVKVDGNSMEPLFCHQDTVLIDRARATPPGSPPAISSRARKTPHQPLAAPVFAFIDPDGHARIKHLRRHAELGLFATSANPSHAPELYPPDEAARITILGQVVAFGRGISSLSPR